jgi:hypothetical protein
MVSHRHENPFGRGRLKVCPDCGEPFVAPPVPFAGRGARMGPYGMALDGAPLLKRAARAIQHDRLYGPTVKDRQENPRLVKGTCPKCLADFWTMPKYGHDLCRCGWLLKIEPLFGALSVDDVVRVFDPTGLSMVRDGAEERLRLKEGVRRIYENWRTRGIAKVEITIEDGKRRAHLSLPTGEYLWDEREDRGRADTQPAG